jgi:hypothetical protein
MLDQESIKGIGKTVAEACLKMTCIITCDPSDTDLAVFSGVFFQDDGHYYVLTAKHCLEDIKKPNTIDLSNYGAQTLNAKFESIQNVEVKNRLVKTDIDIAIIELSPDYAGRLNAEWASREMIAEVITIGDPVYVVGFPKEILRRSSIDKRVIHPTPFAIFSMVTDPPKSESVLNPINTDVDFFIHYQELKYEKKGKQNPHPKGMSGCGIFTFNTFHLASGELWTPNIRLLGIQSSLFQGRFIRGKKATLVLPTIEKSMKKTRKGRNLKLSMKSP